MANPTSNGAKHKPQPRLMSDLAAPYSEEAEEAVIGSILVNPDAFVDVSAFLKADDFYLIRHGYIWQALDRLNKRDVPVDYLTLMQELKDMGWLDDIGGPGYITRLVNNTPTSMHAEFYGRIVERTAKRRRLMTLADELKAIALDETLDIDAVMEQAESRFMKLDDDAVSAGDDVTLFDAINEHMDMVERVTDNPGLFDGVPSSIPQLNNALQGGYGNGMSIVFAGRPGMAKSSMLVAEAIHAAKFGKVYLCTLEMSRAQVTGMILAKVAHLEPLKMARGRMTPEEYKRYLDACQQQAAAIGKNLIINDNPNLTPSMLKKKVKRLAQRGGLVAVFLDYAQLMDGGKEDDYSNRVEELSYISRSLKKLARRHSIPVIAAAQINRSVETRKDKRPMMSDIRESGSFENDGDLIFGLYRDAYYNEVFPPQEHDDLEIIILKGREVDLCTIHVGFWGKWKMVAPVETRRLDPEL